MDTYSMYNQILMHPLKEKEDNFHKWGNKLLLQGHEFQPQELINQF